MRLDRVPALLPFCALAGALPASAAHPVEVELSPRGVLGKSHPVLTLRATTAVRDAHLELVPDTGEPTSAHTGALAAGESFRLELDAPLGLVRYRATLAVTLPDTTVETSELSLTTEVRAGLQIDVPDEHIFLDEGRLELRLSQPAGACDYTIAYDDVPAVKGRRQFAGESPGTWLELRWPPCSGTCVVLRVRLECSAADGQNAGLELFPWWLEIPHEDVSFSTGSAQVVTKELPKVERAHAEIARAVAHFGRVLAVKLFVSGHTDTVGDATKNLVLSTDRARALAATFRRLGVAVPIFYAGYGEDRPEIPTADEVAEPRNRRARYILAVNPPDVGDWREL